MPCPSSCTDNKTSTAPLTCNGELKGIVGTCSMPRRCNVNYPVGHFVNVYDFPTKGVGEYVFAYQAVSCADGFSEVGLLGAEQCVIKVGVFSSLKKQTGASLFEGSFVNALGEVPDTKVRLGYYDEDDKFWALWSQGDIKFVSTSISNSITAIQTGEITINGTDYAAGIIAQPQKTPDNNIFGSVIGAGNDPGTSIGALYLTIPVAGATFSKVGVYGGTCLGDNVVSVAGGMFVARDETGTTIPGTTASLGYSNGTTSLAAIFDGGIRISPNGWKARANVAIGDVYLDGETLKVRIS
mgnify:CR=1 FL=1